MLADDPDREFILGGIREGFRIVDINTQMQTVLPAQTKNSVSMSRNKDAVEKLMDTELQEGRYVRCESKPTIISALAVVPKSDGGLRLIHDLSRPVGGAVNDMASKNTFKCDSISDAISLVGPGWFQAKVDLKSAYRYVPISPKDYDLTGLQWFAKNSDKPEFYCDTRLPFGARKSPEIFHRITQAVKRMMINQGFTATVVYLDDFYVAGETWEECNRAYTALINLLRSLGFGINWRKVVDPCQKLTFLGISIDTVSGTVSLEPEKVDALCTLIEAFKAKTRATRRQLESLAGKLIWASNVIPWGRTHVRTIYDLLSCLKLPSHKCKLQPISEDLTWWLHWLRAGNNTRLIWDHRPVTHVLTDASLEAGGAFCQGDWIYSSWPADFPDLANEHINVKELAAVYIAACRWGKLWQNTKVVIHTDNTVTDCVIDSGSPQNNVMLLILKKLAYLSLKWNFSLSSVHIPGAYNVVADRISRLHEPKRIDELCSLMNAPNLESFKKELCNHMSPRSLMALSRTATCVGHH